MVLQKAIDRAERKEQIRILVVSGGTLDTYRNRSQTDRAVLRRAARRRLSMVIQLLQTFVRLDTAAC